jgi:AraC-like DNA-binding protein
MKKYTCTAADRKKIIKAKEILNNEFNKPFSLTRLSRKVGMSPNKLNYLFKESEMFSPHRFLILLRAAEAINQLLRRKQLRIGEIAGMCGYETTSPFSAMFKRHTGMAPSKWRELQKSAPRGTYPHIMKPLFPRRFDHLNTPMQTN